MLRAVPKGWFSSAYKVLDNDIAVATIDPSFLREAAELTIQRSTYSLYREGLMSGAFILKSGGSILARALKPSALYRSFQVEQGGSNILWKPKAYCQKASSCLKGACVWVLYTPNVRSQERLWLISQKRYL